ncbi:unnamed protein product [Litomosoides sigmodontis]|uniref:C2H2-type domain-containing protein n=1 Tax=Litomosoides sigmodontis TaxID=42156 RepID=A0A3P6UQA3_LITSI|nr:unnamed protein product [Litomosoides sigmodontis]
MRVKVPSSSRKQLVQENAPKCHTSSAGSKDDLLCGTDPVIPEIIRKMGRKVPMRRLDFISGGGHEKNPDDKHIVITKCLRQSHKSLDKQIYHCSNCPSFFTSRRGMANHCKLHGASKRFKCTSCDFGCDNYKTLQMHKAFHTTASKDREARQESIASTHIAMAQLSHPVENLLASNVLSYRVTRIGYRIIWLGTTERMDSNVPFVAMYIGGKAVDMWLPITKSNLQRSASAGFLKRHCELHKPEMYQWPPVYIGKRPSRIAETTADPVKVGGCKEKLGIPEDVFVSSSTISLVDAKQPSVTDSREKQFRILRLGVSSNSLTSNQKYLCGFCGRHFKSYTLRLLHCVIRHSKHTANEKYKSLLRERLNLCNNAMEQTAGNCSVSAQIVHHCAHCPFTCEQKSHLLRHQNKHIVKAEHQCKYCTFTCRSTALLTQHSLLHERIPKLLQMPGRPKDLNPNEKTISTKLEKCSECPYTSRHICDLRTHAQMHVGKREFACGQCTYSTKRSHVLDAHLQLHIAEKEGITAVSSTLTLPQHVFGLSKFYMQINVVGTEKKKLHKTINFTAPWQNCWRTKCSSVVKYVYLPLVSLSNTDMCYAFCPPQNHLKLHSSIEPLLSFPSGKPTVSDEHTEHRNCEYSCQECPFKCNVYGKFWHHKRKHQKTSRYQCDLCSYSAASSFCLAKHRQSHKNSESCDTKMEEFIVVKDCYSDEISAHGTVAREDVIKEKSFIVSQRDELRLNCRKDAKTYQFNLSRIASKLPSFKARHDTESVSEILRCKHCPYFGTDKILFKYHEKMHVGHRQYTCNMCTYSSFCPTSLHGHLNLHFPSLPSYSIAKNRKRLLRHRYHQSPETIPSDVQVHHCSICPYKTAYEDRFQQHRLHHALHLQQRLTTSIKRAAQNISDPFVRTKIRRPEKHLDRQFTCNRCSFRCGTVAAYNTHFEKHGSESFFKCKLCDYSSETKNVVDFHVATHHLDVPISFFYKKALTNPNESQIKLNDDIECRKYPQQMLSCCRCEYRSFMVIDFTCHWEQMHCSRAGKGDRRIAEELRMDMMYSSWIKTVDN